MRELMDVLKEEFNGDARECFTNIAEFEKKEIEEEFIQWWNEVLDAEKKYESFKVLLRDHLFDWDDVDALTFGWWDELRIEIQKKFEELMKEPEDIEAEKPIEDYYDYYGVSRWWFGA